MTSSYVSPAEFMSRMQQSGGKMALSRGRLEDLGAKFMTRNADGLLYLHGTLCSNGAISVLQAASGGLGNPKQFAHSLARKPPLLPVFPQKFVRFTHIDTYGIARTCRKSIPIVSDGGSVPN